MGDAPQRTTLVGIQYLRALAALLVLVAHARNPRPWLFNPLTGWDFTAGVEIFFVISGVIMFAAARDDSPLEFARRRVIRVVPLYWLATLSFVAWLAYRDLDLPSGRDLALSLLMIPHESESYTGHIWPVLVPGWTLNYEMFFYGVFALGLAVRRVAAFSMGALVLAVTAGFVLSPDQAVLKTYTSPILLAFLAGLIIAWARDRVAGFDRAWPLAPLGAVVLAAHFTPWVLLPKLAVIVASGALVAGVMALETRLRDRPVRPALALADASYAIYLFHTLVLAVVYWRGKPLPLDGWPQFLVLMALGIGLSIAVGLAIHRWLERPLLRKLNRLGRPGPRTASSSRAPDGGAAASQARS
ncbi:acyltransferase family protein [Phenylobacterium sp.]|uniref:acyltransferase family protein n=1 Tax=Phenylobacterium sp. TaxID=1871053 RepID=UPI0035B3DDAD